MATAEIKTTFQVKRGTAERWLEVNPVLKQGEPGYEFDTHRLKIGDGIKYWTELPYIGIQDVITVDTLDDLTKLNGDINILYKVETERVLYRWNATTSKFEPLNGANVIEGITLNGIAAPIEDKNVNIPAATSEALGLARPDTKTLSVDEQGVFSIKAVSTDLLVEGEDELILYGGNANS